MRARYRILPIFPVQKFHVFVMRADEALSSSQNFSSAQPFKFVDHSGDV